MQELFTMCQGLLEISTTFRFPAVPPHPTHVPLRFTLVEDGESRDYVEKVFEPLDEGRWTELDTETGRRELAFGEEVRQELEMPEEDEESESN